MDISKSFLQDPSFSSVLIPTVAYRYILWDTDSADSAKKFVYHEVSAQLRFGGERIAQSGPHYIAQEVSGGQQTHLDLSFPLPRWLLDRMEAIRNGDPAVDIQIDLAYSVTDQQNKTTFLHANQYIDLRLSALKWSTWLAKLGYSDFHRR